MLNGKFFRVDSLTGFPTSFDFIFYYTPLGQINDVTFGDFDNNKITDCVFINWPKTIIGEYMKSQNNFNTLFEYSIQMGDYQSGFAICDFDQDGKIELVFGTTLQNVYVIEAEDTNQYSVIWYGLAATYNAFMITQTNDIDKNGKPEFWIGGQDFGDGISKFTCYEANGDNSYLPVAYVELRNLVSLYTNYLQAADIDNDGTEELVISLGNYLLVLKFHGNPNYHNYKLFYIKKNEGTQVGAEFQPVTICDFNNDGHKDILLPMNKNNNVFSYILAQNSLSVLNEHYNEDLLGLNISHNYPNPYNNSTFLKFITNSNVNVSVIVYNILGKEIKTLFDGELKEGEHTIEWNGKDSIGNSQTSGIYFIRIRSAGFTKTIKTILLK